MILQCEKCKTKFKLDESLLKPQGSKVKCAVCKNVFVAFPPPDISADEAETVAVTPDQMDELTRDLPQDLSDEKEEFDPEQAVADFDEAFSESMEDLAQVEVESIEPEPEEPVEEEKPRKGLFGRSKRSEKAKMKKEAPPPEIEEVQDMAIEEDMPKPVVAASKPKKKMGILPIILIFILLVVGGGAAIFFWAPDLLPDSLSFLKPTKKHDATDIGIRRLSFKAVTGSFIDSKSVGPLFAVRGVVRNGYPKKRSFILIRASILDDKGKVVRRKLAYAANTFKDEDLKNMSLELINKAMKNRQGKGRKNINIAPGANTPFMVVFENLPDNLSEFTVEAVSSSPGTK